MGETATRFVIFSDLDGTLLDHRAYTFDAALPALQLVRRLEIPLVLCSSKTRLEIERYRGALENTDPFVVENGGAIFMPKGYFPFPHLYHKEVEGYEVVEYGFPYARLVRALQVVKRESGVKLVGFSDLSAKGVASLAHLTPEEAALAKQREYDEPFLIEGNGQKVASVKRLLTRLGFRCVQGGRFYHLTGPNDKGRAVSTLAQLFRERDGEVCTIGIGDSRSDLPMLRAVEIPVLVQKEDGTYDPSVRLPRLVYAKGAGPTGWNRAIVALLS